MRPNKHITALLIAVAALILTPMTSIQGAPGSSTAFQNGFANLPGRTLQLSALKISGVGKPDVESVSFMVTLTNTGAASFRVDPSDFTLAAEGDIFGQTSAPTPASSFTGAVQPREVRAGRLTFVIPVAAFPIATAAYHPQRENISATIPLRQVPTTALAPNQSSAQQARVSSPATTIATQQIIGPSSLAATSTNTVEDNFTRSNQTGWGTTTNSDGVTPVAWGLKGDGSRPEFTIKNSAGVVSWMSGDLNTPLQASAGSTQYTGGDALAKIMVSTAGNVIVYIAMDYNSNGSNYYALRLQTSLNQIIIAKKSKGSVINEVTAPFTTTANTWYWMRMNANPATKTIMGRIWLDGAPEPATWTLSWTDSGSWLAQNYSTAGATWNVTPTGAENVSYACYAFSANPSVSAQTCSASVAPTPTPAPTATATPIPGATATPTPTATPIPTVTNTIEDNFNRLGQTGWGTSANLDGVPNVVWGMDGNGGLSYVTISNNTGVYAYPGATNVIGVASAGSAVYNGGDALVRFSVSAVGHITPYVVLNACSDKSCYYGARMHSSQNLLELAKRVNGGTSILASTAFTPSANTAYWMRLDVTPGSGGATLRARIWADGTPEPSTWMVTATDATPLASNLPGTGGSWDLVGTGESMIYTCYAFATSGLANPCVAPTGSPTPTPAPTATATPGPTPTATPIPAGTVSTISLSGGNGDTWGTAIDAAGNVWFAEPGCDFAPTCSSSIPPGQIGKLAAGSTTPVFYTLPNITGNQPIFVALDATGKVWFTTPNNSMIGEFDPTTSQFVGQWAVTAGSGPWDLTFNNGKIWYTEHLVSSIGEFDPTTHTHQDFATPTANTNPYGITANDPVNGNLIWFTENNSSVARIAVLDTTTNAISEYPIRASLQNISLTPHMIALDAQGNLWWTEGWVRAIGMLNPSLATSGQCGATSGNCVGVTEYSLPASNSSCGGSHVSGMAIQGGGTLIWLDDSLSAQVGSYSPSTGLFALNNISCSHPHDGLNMGLGSTVWWDEEFANALGRLN